jgi:hypothetical protein
VFAEKVEAVKEEINKRIEEEKQSSYWLKTSLKLLLNYSSQKALK